MSNEEKFTSIITKAWNDYKGSVTAFVVLKQRFEEDLKKITNPVQQQTFIDLHVTETNKAMRVINNHFNYFNKIYSTNLSHVNTDFCNKIDREIQDIKNLLSAVETQS